MAGEDSSRGEAPTPATAEAAFLEAVALLARKPLTEAELCARLRRRGRPDASIAPLLDRLRRAGYVDDRRLALHFIATRASRLGHGPRRLIDDLKRRGLDDATAERAWREAIEQGEVDPGEVLRREIRRRVGPRRSIGLRLYRRVYNALLRAGFEAASVDEELGPFRVEVGADEGSDDFA